MARFDPESYLRYRIEYPAEVFAPLASFVAPRASSLRLIDLGAGTGLATRSFLQFFPHAAQAVLLDPDPAMLAAAVRSESSLSIEMSSRVASGETFRVSDPVDLILVGSAWHWMNSPETISAIRQALKPGGALFVFEYQFPKAKGREGERINEWVRRAFNSAWKETDQKPRGSLKELLFGFFESPDFSFRGEAKVEKDFELRAEDLFGVILSQSRYLAYERGVPEGKKETLRGELYQDLNEVWGSCQTLPFSYRFHGVRFQNRSV